MAEQQITRRLKDAGDRTLLSLSAAQISNFAAAVRGTVLAGISIASGSVTATDTVLSALGKLIYKVSNLTKADVGLVNVANLAPADLPLSSAANAALSAKADLVAGKVPVSQLPDASNAVNSVNGQTGTVVLTKNDLGLANVANTSDAQKPVSTAQAAALALKADLVSGKIPTSQIPAVALTEFLGTVTSQTAMLALAGQRGDWCIRSDQSKSFVLTADDAAVLANWQPVAYPASSSAVSSINGQTGTVVLGKGDVGLGSVPNVDATNPANTVQSANYRFATDTEKSSWNAKQPALGFTPLRSAAGSPTQTTAVWVGTAAELAAITTRDPNTIYLEKQ